MKGSIDANGRALLNVEILGDSTQQPQTIEVWVDTGFTGDLVFPQPLIDSLGLHHSGTVDAILADGSTGGGVGGNPTASFVRGSLLL